MVEFPQCRVEAGDVLQVLLSVFLKYFLTKVFPFPFSAGWRPTMFYKLFSTQFLWVFYLIFLVSTVPGGGR